MRCPECNKFASYAGDETPELESIEVDQTSGTVTAQVRIHKDCADCSTELKEASLELETDLPEAFVTLHCDSETGVHELVVDETVEPEPIEEYDNPGRPARYQKTYYGATLETTVTCTECGDSVTVTLTDKVPASAMDECC